MKNQKQGKGHFLKKKNSQLPSGVHSIIMTENESIVGTTLLKNEHIKLSYLGVRARELCQYDSATVSPKTNKT